MRLVFPPHSVARIVQFGQNQCPAVRTASDLPANTLLSNRIKIVAVRQFSGILILSESVCHAKSGTQKPKTYSGREHHNETACGSPNIFNWAELNKTAYLLLGGPITKKQKLWQANAKKNTAFPPKCEQTYHQPRAWREQSELTG